MNDCPFRYQGQYQDEETGLYYNRFRYYDPNVGNYISKDPIGLEGGNPTLYGYVHDTNGWVDKLGLDINGQVTFKEAFRRAKQQLRIPSNVNTPRSVFVYDSQYENRTVWAFEGEHKDKFIIMHQEDKFERGSHLHTATSIDDVGNVHQSPLEKGRYNQHEGHIPENSEGLTNVQRITCPS